MTENIQVFTQSSIRIKTEKAVIYVDPFMIDKEYSDADYILVTHDHFDHFSPEAIKKIVKDNKETVLVVPRKMRETADEVSHLVKEIVTVEPGDHVNLDALEIETVPAYNIMKPFHTKGSNWVGYIIIADGKRIYIAGDTDYIDELKKIRCDVALVPVGGKYTMDARKAASLVNYIKPSVAIPTHYGSVVGRKEDGEKFAKLVKEPVKTELKLHFD